MVETVVEGGEMRVSYCSAASNRSDNWILRKMQLLGRSLCTGEKFVCVVCREKEGPG